MNAASLLLLTENEDAQNFAAAWPSMAGCWVPGVQGGRLLYESPDPEDLETFLDTWASAASVPPGFAVDCRAARLLSSGICARLHRFPEALQRSLSCWNSAGHR